MTGNLFPHPYGGVRTVTDATSEHDKLHEQIAADTENGSLKHRRLPEALRHVPPLVFTADAGLLLYFFSIITNVNWGRPFSAALLFATLLAGMITGISFAFFRFTADRLQQYKDDTGAIPLRGLDAGTNISMGLAAVAMVVLAALMFLRMYAEVTATLGPRSGGTAIIIGLTLALVSFLANTLVIAVHAFDGSPEADRLIALGQAVYGPLSDQHQLREQADTLDHQIAILGREAERAAAKGITGAGYKRAEYDRIIAAGRAVHQGTGSESDPAVNPNDEEGVIGYRRSEGTPEVDERPLHLTLDHIHTPLGEELPRHHHGVQELGGDQEQPAA